MRTQRDALTAEPAMLSPFGNPSSGAGERLASYLEDLSTAWKDATAEERNMIARQIVN